MTKIAQHAFVGGALSPEAASRYDIDQYRFGLSEAKNVFVRKEGGVESRPGALFLNDAKSPTTRLRKFEFSAGQSYVLELSDRSARIWYNQALVEGPYGEPAHPFVREDNPSTYDWWPNAAGDGWYFGVDAAPSPPTDPWAALPGGVAHMRPNSVWVVGDPANPLYALNRKHKDVPLTNFFPGTGMWKFDDDPAFAYPQITVRLFGNPDPQSPSWTIYLCWAVEVTLPYLESELFDLNFAQSGDTLVITHPNHPPGQLVRFGATTWTYSVIDFAEVPDIRVNQERLNDYPMTAGTDVVEIEYAIATVDHAGRESRPVTVKYLNDKTPSEFVNDPVPPIDTTQGVVMDSVIENDKGDGSGGWLNTTLNIKDQAALRSTIARYVVYRRWKTVVERGYRTSAVDASTGIPIADPNGAPTPGDGWGLIGEIDPAEGWEGRRIPPTLVYSPVGTDAVWQPPYLLNHPFFGFKGTGFSPILTYGLSVVVFTNIVGSGVNSQGITPASLEGVQLVVEQWTALPWIGVHIPGTTVPVSPGFPGATTLKHDGTFTLTSFDYEFFEVPVLHDKGDLDVLPNYSIKPHLEGPTFTGVGNYPGLCAFYEQRLFLAASDNEPTTLWGSRPGQPFDFSTLGTLNPASTFIQQIYDKTVNRLTSVLALDSLLVGTPGSVHRIWTQDDSFSAASAQAKIQTSEGYSNIEPINARGAGLLVTSDKREVHRFKYSLQENAYVPEDLTRFVSHYFTESVIVDWAYMPLPFNLIWVVLGDGRLLSCTYVPEEGVVAWSEHEMSITDISEIYNKREVTSIEVIQESGGEYVLYVAVRATDESTGAVTGMISRIQHEGWMPYLFDYLRLDEAYSINYPTLLVEEVSYTLTTDHVVFKRTGYGLLGGTQVFFDGFGADYALDRENLTEGGVNGRVFAIAQVDADHFKIKDLAGVFQTAEMLFTPNPVTGVYPSAAHVNARGLGGYEQMTTFWYMPPHLEGRDVHVVSNAVPTAGSTNGVGETVVSTHRVSGGMLMQAPRCSRIRAGVAYDAYVTTLPIDFGKAAAEATEEKRVVASYPLLRGTAGVSVDRDPDVPYAAASYVARERREHDGYKEAIRGSLFVEYPGWSKSAEVVSGYARALVSGAGYNGHARVTVRQRFPLPMSLLSILREIDFLGDEEVRDGTKSSRASRSDV
jgi:hypothetical protein